MKHAHLLLHCFETLICLVLSMFMPSIAIALSISEKYVPLFQSVAALGTISLVVYTFGKEFKKNGWFVKMWDGIAYFFYLLFLIIFYFPMRWTRKMGCMKRCVHKWIKL